MKLLKNIQHETYHEFNINILSTDIGDGFWRSCPKNSGYDDNNKIINDDDDIFDNAETYFYIHETNFHNILFELQNIIASEKVLNEMKDKLNDEFRDIHKYIDTISTNIISIYIILKKYQ